MKRQMVVSLNKVGDEEQSKHPQRDNCENKCLADFVTFNTRQFFQKLKLDQKFLEEDHRSWKDHLSFQSALRFVQSIEVINDSAEKRVALIHKCNQLMTHDEGQLQFLLQVVTEHRCAFPD